MLDPVMQYDLGSRLRHPHIYGIDLASPSELIAHHRTSDEIAQHIHAEKVIFQSLEDVKVACADAVVPGLPKHPQQEFEVGIFSGEYVTPVPKGYFEHLEKIRGETKKMKVIERAREAVANGSACKEDIEMATNGVEVNGDGNVVPASRANSNDRLDMDGAGDGADPKRRKVESESRSPRNQMDITIHNLNDFPA